MFQAKGLFAEDRIFQPLTATTMLTMYKHSSTLKGLQAL